MLQVCFLLHHNRAQPRDLVMHPICILQRRLLQQKPLGLHMCNYQFPQAFKLDTIFFNNNSIKVRERSKSRPYCFAKPPFAHGESTLIPRTTTSRSLKNFMLSCSVHISVSQTPVYAPG